MENPHVYLKLLNDFIEDTAVIVATAYLLGRGRILSMAFQDHVKKRESIRLGLILGLIALTEVFFPGERYPYLTDTLTTGFAAIAGGPVAGLISALIVSCGAVMLQPWPAWCLRTADVFLAFAVCGLLRRPRVRYNVSNALIAGMLSQSVVLVFHYLASPVSRHYATGWYGAGAVLGNGVGMVLTTKVFREAWVRVNSEQNRLAAEQAKALAAKAQLAATKAQLAALRGRIHPHFLYNALTSISALCGIAPGEAEEAAAQLGELMRRTLDAGAVSTIPLSTELEYVRIYLGIEQRRFGDRLHLAWNIDEACLQIMLPPFSIQTLVENAVRHGAARVLRPVTITVTVRRAAQRVQVAVADNGGGMLETVRRGIDVEDERAVHGLQILSGQLNILFGRTARLRLFSVRDKGTLAVFAVPLGGNHAD